MRIYLQSARQLRRGFSLVEILIVIAVIGIIASIAVPSVGSITGSAQTASAKRNAQSLVSIYQSGRAAGVPWGASSVDTAASAVESGATGNNGTYFGVQGMDATALIAAKNHLIWDSTVGLIYIP